MPVSPTEGESPQTPTPGDTMKHTENTPNPIPQETAYMRNGYADRDEYLQALMEESSDAEAVEMLADLLGPEEDFDGLVTALEDYGLI